MPSTIRNDSSAAQLASARIIKLMRLGPNTAASVAGFGFQVKKLGDKLSLLGIKNSPKPRPLLTKSPCTQSPVSAL